MLLFNVVIANAMTFLATMTDEQSAKRAEMIDQLAEANAKLADALRENAGLHASCWPRPARPACWTSGSGWPARSTTCWPRA